MEFCDKCGTLMLPNKGGKTVACPNCGARAKAEQIIIKEVSGERHIRAKKTGKEIKDTMPLTDATCQSCGNKEAYWWSEQTRGTDEPETQFFRCTKCSKTWRKYN